MKEFDQNLNKVIEDTEEGVRTILAKPSSSESKKLQNLSDQLGIDTTDSGAMEERYTSESLKVARKWLSSSIVIPESDTVKTRAKIRVQNLRRPASKARDSYADCLILENYLDVIRQSRELGLPRSVTVIFISSNTSDFCIRQPSGLQPGVLHPDIATDFADLDMIYARFMRDARTQISFTQ